MAIHVEERFAVHPDDYRHYDTEQLRKHFLVETLFAPDDIYLTYTHYERMIVGGAMPVNTPLHLEPVDQLRAERFLERREMGAVNIGGDGAVVVDGERYPVASREAMYIGRGSGDVVFESAAADNPAKFYINSTPAHRACPTRRVGRQDARVLEMGASETCNERRINQLLINGVVETCQLQMGMTELAPGSIWNTMPVHTHSRRMEVYLYFQVPDGQAVCHFMGPREQTRHIWAANEQAVVSPPWSMHSGVGTAHYVFIWGMAGENLDYTDMDFHQPHELR